MQGTWVPYDRYTFWAFIVLSVLSHARGTVLLLREARLWLWNRAERRKRRTPRY